MSRTIHCHLSIRGFLMHSTFPEQYAHMLKRADGEWLTPDETRDILYDQLEAGNNALPFGPPCAGFDYKTGCPGQEIEEQTK